MNILILTATSGDTGKAALEGFKDVDRTKIMVFYPNDGVSTVQKNTNAKLKKEKILKFVQFTETLMMLKVELKNYY